MKYTKDDELCLVKPQSRTVSMKTKTQSVDKWAKIEQPHNIIQCYKVSGEIEEEQHFEIAMMNICPVFRTLLLAKSSRIQCGLIHCQNRLQIWWANKRQRLNQKYQFLKSFDPINWKQFLSSHNMSESTRNCIFYCIINILQCQRR